MQKRRGSLLLAKVNGLMEAIDSWLQSRLNLLDLDSEKLGDIAQLRDEDLPHEIKEINEAVAGHFVIRNEIKFEDYNHLFGVIDQKSSALLTHISVMSAVTAIVISADQLDFPILDVFSILFLATYIGTAFIVLRLLRFWSFGSIDFLSLKDRHSGFNNSDYEVLASKKTLSDQERLRFFEIVMRKELFFRSRLYRSCLNITSMVTAASMFLLALYLIAFGLSEFTGAARGD